MILPIIGAAAAVGVIWALARKSGPTVPASIPPPGNPIVPPTVHKTDMITAANAASAADPSNMVPVELNGETWLVAPEPIGPVGIGEALNIATSLGLQLPTPALVDAIWNAADLRIAPPVRASDGTPKTMSTPAVFEDQRIRIEKLIDGRPFTLLAGTHKDVVMMSNGKPGLYGWNVENPAEFTKKTGVPTHTIRGANGERVTAGPVIQQIFGGHGLSWSDYSQGLRLVRKV